MYLLYTHYNRGKWQRVPHFEMLTSISFLAVLNLATLSSFLSKSNWIFRGSNQSFLFKFVILLSVITLALNIAGNKKVLESLTYPENIVRRGYRVFILYAVLSFLAFFCSIYIESKRDRLDAEMPTKITPKPTDSLE